MLPLRLLTAVFCHSGRPESTILVVTQASVSQPYPHVRREISYPSPRKFRLARPRAPRRSGDDSQSYPADGQVGVNGPGREGGWRYGPRCPASAALTGPALDPQAAGQVGGQHADGVDFCPQLAELLQPRVHPGEGLSAYPGVLGEVDAAPGREGPCHQAGPAAGPAAACPPGNQAPASSLTSGRTGSPDRRGRSASAP